MSKRLQVLLAERELEEIQRLARRERLTVAAWERRGVSEIMTFDQGFNSRPGIRVVGG